MTGDITIGTVNIERIENLNVYVLPEAKTIPPDDDFWKNIREQLEAGAGAQALRDIGYTEVPEEEDQADDTPEPELVGNIPRDVWDFIREQLGIGADPESLRETGYKGVPEEEVGPEETPTPEEQDEADQSRAEEYISRYVTQERVDALARASHLRNLAKHVPKVRQLEGFQTNHVKDPKRHPRKPRKVETVYGEEYTMAEEALISACGKCIFRGGGCKFEGSLEGWLNVHPYRRDKTGKRRPGSSQVKEVESQLTFLDDLAEDSQAHCDPAKRKQ